MLWFPLAAAALGTCWPAHSAHAQVRGPSATSEPDTVSAARKHFELGMQLYREGNPRAALVEMQRAHAIAPSTRLLFNIGQAALEAKDYATAYDALTRYLASEPAELTPSRRREVEADLGAASSRVGFLVLETDLESPEATIDGVPARLDAPAIPLESGRHELRVAGRDGTSISRFVDISAGGSTRVRIARPVQPAPPSPIPPAAPSATLPNNPPPSPSATRPPVESARIPWLWTGISATAAFGVTAVVLGVVTSKADSAHEALLREVPGDPGRIQSSQQRVKSLALMTDIALGATLIGTAATLTLFLIDRDASAHERQVSVGVGAGQLRVEGAF